MITATTVTDTDDGSVAQPGAGWQAELRAAESSARAMDAALRLTEAERRGIDHARASGLRPKVTAHFLGLCDPLDAACPIRRQVVPHELEAREVPGDLEDPLGEQEHEVAPHLVRRYPDRALLIATLQCAVHCRFCTRSRLVRTGQGVTPMVELEPAFAWLRAHPEVQEVLISGGDPLTMSTARLVELVDRLRAIGTLRRLRIGTRTPSALPSRIDDELVQALRGRPAIWFMVHFNHPKELTAQAREALGRLADGGFPLMNQAVMLRGINDDPEVLAELFRGLVDERVRPYYLLHCDVAKGTSHLRTTLDRSVAVYRELLGKVSGIAVPKLIVDTPRGRGKVQVGPETIVEREPGRTVLRTWRGERVELTDPPSE